MYFRCKQLRHSAHYKYVTCVGTSTIITDICVGILTDFLGCFVFCHYTPVTWTDDELHQLQCEIKKKKKYSEFVIYRRLVLFDYCTSVNNYYMFYYVVMNEIRYIFLRQKSIMNILKINYKSTSCSKLFFWGGWVFESKVVCLVMVLYFGL